MNLEALLASRLGAAFSQVAGATVDPAVRRSRHADFQSGAALPLARRLDRAPRDLAGRCSRGPTWPSVATAEVSGPGFLNLRLADEAIAAAANEVAADPRLGVPAGARPERIVVDYSSPNIAKELTIGHLRSTVIGDAAARLLEWLGHDVVRANHLGDWGTAFGLLIEHLGTGDAAGIGDLTAFYQAARLRFDTDEEFRTRARLRVVALQAGDEPTLRQWRHLVAESQRYLLLAYDRMDVTLGREHFIGESFYNDRLESVVAELADKGLLVESEGALCAFPPGRTGRTGDPLPLIVRKSDGGFGYAATDLAALRYRVRELGATRLLYVVGAPQRTHFEMVFAVAAAARLAARRRDGGARRLRLDPRHRRQDVPQPVRRVRPAGRRGGRGDRPYLGARARAGGGPGRRHRRDQVRGPVRRPDVRLRLRLGPDAGADRQHRAVPAVRVRPDTGDPAQGGRLRGPDQARRGRRTGTRPRTARLRAGGRAGGPVAGVPPARSTTCTARRRRSAPSTRAAPC
nr:hypothetical protein GCM10020092_089500 [Actinoplanes digitatis]